MQFLTGPRQFSPEVLEKIDMPGADPLLLRDELRHVRTINRFLGGLSSLRRGVLSLAMKVEPGHTIRILDLATGSADIPIALTKELRRMGRRVHITAVDNNEQVLAVARELSTGLEEIQFEHRDILVLPYERASFDVVSCSLAMHHFSRKDAVKILQEMDRIGRIGFVVNDLARSHIATIAAWIYTRSVTLNPMTRYDAVLSARRAFTRDEFLSIAREAGIGHIRVIRAPLFRLVAIKENWTE